MKEHINDIEHQIIRDEHGAPLYVLVPWDEYNSPFSPGEGDDSAVPWEVAKKTAMEEKSPIRAWREHLGLTQAEAADRMGIDQSSYARIEKAGVRSRRATLEKVAKAFGIEVAKLNL